MILYSEHSMDLYLKKCTVSCQTDNIISSYRKPSSREYTYPESSNTPLFNNSYGLIFYLLIIKYLE